MLRGYAKLKTQRKLTKCAEYQVNRMNCVENRRSRSTPSSVRVTLFFSRLSLGLTDMVSSGGVLRGKKDRDGRRKS